MSVYTFMFPIAFVKAAIPSRVGAVDLGKRQTSLESDTVSY